MSDKENVFAWLSEVLDPEVPVLNIVEMGLVRDVTFDSSGGVTISITPTYSGCPAMDTIKEEVRNVLKHKGFSDVSVVTVLSPPWTTDWLGEDARAKLKRYGISPPGSSGTAEDVQFVPFPKSAGKILCPRCNSDDTEVLSEFGSTSCKAMCRCRACREPFEHFKRI